MTKDNATEEIDFKQWAITPEWFDHNNRSLADLLGNYLCPKCSKQLSAKAKPSSPDILMNTIRDCCSSSPDFLNDKQPVFETVFRLLLRNGNNPLSTMELCEKLSQMRGGNAFHSSPEALFRILRTDTYYGLQEITD